MEGTVPWRGTYSDHQLACAAALACLAEYEERGLVENSRRLGVVLLERLCELARRHPRVGDVRGKALLACLELVHDRTTCAPLVSANTDSPLPLRIRRRGWDEGIHLMACGSLA